MIIKKTILTGYYFSIIILLTLYTIPPYILAFFFKVDPTITLVPSKKIGVSIYHFISVFIFTNLGYFANNSKLNLLIIFILSFTLEFLHYFLPYRSFEMKDFFGNMSGFLVAIIIIIIIKNIRK